MAKALSRLTIGRDGDDYLLSIEDEDGDTTEIVASFEQLELLNESLEEHLAFDIEDSDAPDDDDEDEE